MPEFPRRVRFHRRAAAPLIDTNWMRNATMIGAGRHTGGPAGATCIPLGVEGTFALFIRAADSPGANYCVEPARLPTDDFSPPLSP